MLISVVIPTHNRPELLSEAVASVGAQTHRDWEIVIVDDGSTPPVDAGLLTNAAGPRLRVVRHPVALGVPKAKNAGVRAAQGEIILLLDDDDLLVPSALERVNRIFSDHPHLDCVFLGVEPFGRHSGGAAQGREAALDRIKSQCSPRESDGIYLFGASIFDALLAGVPIDFQRPAARRGAWNIVGMFDEGSLFSESAWAMKATANCKVALTVEPLTRWRLHGDNFGWPSDMSVDQIKARQIENGIRASTELLRSFEERESLAISQRKSIATSLASQLFDGAYHFRDGDRPKGLRLLAQSFWIDPQWRHLRLALTFLLPRSRRSVRRIRADPESNKPI